MDERYGAAYRTLYERHWWWRARERLILGTLPGLLPRNGGAAILDVGCGDGLLFDRLAEFGDVEGIESDSRLITIGGRWAHRIHVGGLDDGFAPGKTYQLLLMLDVLEHIANPGPVLRSAYTHVTPGGAVLITVPAFEAIWTRHDDLNYHHTRYTKATLLPLVCQAGFTIDRARYYFQWLFATKLALGLFERLRPGLPQVPRVPPRLVNETAYRLSLAEQALARVVPMPFGSSLLVVARKPR